MAGALGAVAARASTKAFQRSLLLSASSSSSSSRRTYATVTGAAIPAKPHHRVVIVGAGTAGVTVAAQLLRTKAFKKDEIAILDPAQEHHYQPGWTLVGSGLKPLSDMSRPLASVIPEGVTHYPLEVKTLDPEENQLQTADGVQVSYDYLVVAPGLEVNVGGVQGLAGALQDPASGVSSIYVRESVEQVWRNIEALKAGTAVFTQPAGAIKCAGAPQKIMWMALSQWEKNGVRKEILPYFATGAGAMFAVPKYSKALEQLRVQRQVEGLFNHNLVSIDAKKKVAVFSDLLSKPEGNKKAPTVEIKYDFLHVTPPQKPRAFIANSPLSSTADAGWVSVDKSTTQHTTYKNVFSLGDASSLPNSKTAAAISSQAPVLVDNLLAAMRSQELKAGYTGYASCPLLTGHNELMLCEFKYGGVPDETFAKVPGIGSQDVPRRVFYHLKKDFFPSVYWSSFLKGTWYGPRGWFRPDTTKSSA